MKIAIDKIQVKERIRKEMLDIDKLAANITQNGLLNAITVMPQSGEQGDETFSLLAGLRRLRAVQQLGWTEIDVHIVTPADAEAVLRIEISENEQRMPFTFSEKIDFARLLEEIETAKALERKSLGGKGGLKEDVNHGSHLPKGRARDVIGDKIGMSGMQYSRAKFVAENAPQEVIDEIDCGKRSVRKAYDELRSAEKQKEVTPPAMVIKNPEPQAATPPKTPDPAPLLKTKQSAKINPLDLMSKQEQEQIRKNAEYDALPPEGKIAELQSQLRAERCRAATAESELSRLKELRHNDVLHMQANIDNLKQQLETAHSKIDQMNALETENACLKNNIFQFECGVQGYELRIKELKEALSVAQERINELEGKYESD